MRALITLVLLTTPIFAACPASVDPKASLPLGTVLKTTDCHVHISPTGYPLPDPECTPGAVNPTVTLQVLRSKGWSTRCVRDKATSAQEKHALYAAYGINPPSHNQGKSQTCELDHLVPLEDGGADTLDNVWPQCGPSGMPLNSRWFKIKDKIENALTRTVKNGGVGISYSQMWIAKDWSQ